MAREKLCFTEFRLAAWLLLTRRVTRGMGRGEGIPCPFSKIGKNCPNLGKKCPDFGHFLGKIPHLKCNF